MSKLKSIAKKLVKQFQKSASEMEVDELKEERRELYYYREVTQNLPNHKLVESDKEKVIAIINDMIDTVNITILKKEGKI